MFSESSRQYRLGQTPPDVYSGHRLDIPPFLIARRLDAAEFDARLRVLEAPTECGALFARVIAPFGFEAFASGEIDLYDQSRSTLHLVDQPDSWAQLQGESGPGNRNPILEKLADRCNPFTWTELRADPSLPRTAQRLLNSAKVAGWNEGLVIPIRQPSDRIGFVSLAARAAGIDAMQRGYLTFAGTCLHNHVRTLLGKHGFATPPAGLTPREIDALRLVVRGMSDNAIGRALGIASSTAHEFVEKAKRKMKVRSRAELAALAVSLSIVNV